MMPNKSLDTETQPQAATSPHGLRSGQLRRLSLARDGGAGTAALGRLEEAPEDAAGITRALGDIARAKGMSQVARDAGLSRESLYKALSETGNPSFATVLKVARALGVKFHAQPV